MLTKKEINEIAETMATETNGKSFGEILEIWSAVVHETVTMDEWSKIVIAFIKKWKKAGRHIV